MKPKTITKICIDWLMILLLMMQMGRHLWGNLAHEWIGAGMFALFIIHQVLNLAWYKTMFKGKYTAYRIVRLIINALALAAMIGMILSGVILSQQVFAFLPIKGGTSFARILHMLATYWGFVLMGLHLGLHWDVVMGLHWKTAVGMVRKTTRPTQASPARATVLNIAGIAIAAYGFYAFIDRELISYMLLRSQFVFFDYEESKILFYLDYLAMMGFFVWIAHNFVKLLRKRSAGKKIWQPEESASPLGGTGN